MPLQNRVTPLGEIIAVPARGLLMGNRGGRMHDPETRTLLPRHHVSKRWICCLTAFAGRHRTVMGPGYTELFFLDEATALAAGHRPCFECRRQAARGFAACWQAAQGLERPPRAQTMDAALHLERTGQRTCRPIADLPDGAAILLEIMGDLRPAFLRNGRLLPWSPEGYGPALPHPPGGEASVLTPASTLAVLAKGYSPLWHPSAG